MPVVATFKADFSDFLNKAKQAEGSLDKLADAAGSTSKSVSAVGASFGGEKLIRQAVDAAKAVEAIGGASMLTEKEQARLNATVTEGLNKMKALGIQAPADLVNIKKETQNAADAFAAMKNPLAALGTQLTAALGPVAIATTVINATKQFLDLTGKLSDLSAKTGISTTALQTLGYVTEQAGVSVESIADAVNKMGRNLVEGNASAVSGVKQLGLHVDDLLKMSPDQAFVTIGDAIGAIKNPAERSAAAVAIFGKAGAELLPAFTGNLKALSAEALNSGAILSENMVAGGDRAGDALGRLWKAVQGLIGSALSPLMPVIEAVAGALQQLFGLISKYNATVMQVLTRGFLEAKVELLEFAVSAMELTRKIPILGEKFGFSAEAVASMRTSVEAAKQSLEDFKAKGSDPVKKSLDQVAPVVGVYGENQKKLEAETKKAAEAHKKFVDSVRPLPSMFTTLAPAVKSYGDELANIMAGFKADGTLMTSTLQETAADTAAAKKETEDWAKKWGLLPPVIKSMKTETEQAKSTFASLKDVGMAAIGGLNDVFTAAFEGGGGVGGAIKSLATSVTSGLLKMIPGVGPILSQFSGAFIAGISKLFGGVSAEVKKAREEITSFEQSLWKNLTATQAAEANGQKWAMTTIAVRDAYLAVGKTAAEAEAIVKQLWDDKNPAASKAAIEQITAILKQAEEAAKKLNEEFAGAFQEGINLGVTLPEAMQATIQQLITMGKLTGDAATLFGTLTGETEVNSRKMEEAAKRYGIELAALGPAFQSAKLNEAAAGILEDFNYLTKGGADVNGVLFGMRDEISQLVNDSLKFGVAIPENMRPLIETLAKSGELTDEQGNKFTDLSKLNWTTPIKTATEKLIEKIQELIDKISGGLGFDKAQTEAQTFADRATDAINKIPRVVKVSFEGDGRDAGDTPGYAVGTKGRTGQWFTNFGAGQPAILHGDEAVVRRDQAAAFAADVGGETVGSGALLAELAALRTDFAGLPRVIGRAVRDAVLVAG